MSRLRLARVLFASTGLLATVCAQDAAAPSTAPGKLMVTVGKSLIIDSPMKIQRISVANGELIEAVPVNPKEVLINGKSAGETTSLIIWQEDGNRLLYNLTVRISPARLDVVRQQLARDFPNDDINVVYENDVAFVRGTVRDIVSADRVMAMTASLGKTVNLLRVDIRINFLPRITPRGTIQLMVAPEVSALDYANAVTFQGYTIPALSTRRVSTEVELESGQSFVIAGLMDNTMTETLKIPGLSAIPLLGKIFTSRSQARNNTELLVIVTPEVVRPIPAGMPLPNVRMPFEFRPRNSESDMFQPGMDKTGPVPVKAPNSSMPIEQLIEIKRKEGQAAPPVTLNGPVGPVAPPSGAAAPAATPAAGSGK